MAALLAVFVICLGVLVGSVWWLSTALMAALKRQKRPGLYWGAPVALIALCFSIWEVGLLLVGFAVALANGGTGTHR